jgi:hypothetical protein
MYDIFLDVATKARKNLPKDLVENVAKQLEEALPKCKELDQSTLDEIQILLVDNILKPLAKEKMINQDGQRQNKYQRSL